jgi:tripartite-type tricarboxylate transporter receptor subunit TctC
MERTRRGFGTMLAGGGTAALLSRPSFAQSPYPSRPVTLVVPQAPGGTNDIIARFLADKLGEALGGGRVVVENRVGAGGNIGTSSVARASPDGYTLLVTLSSGQAINPALYARTGFDPVRDFDPVTMLARVPNILMVHPSLPVNSVSELIALAKKEGGQLQYGSAGNGTLNHLLGVMLMKQAGIQFVHVPYRGVAPMLNDMLGGQVKIGFASLPSVISYIQAKSLKALGTSGAARDPAIPDVPSIAEAVPGFAGDVWTALFVPKGVPAPIRERIHAAAHQAMNDPSVRQKMAAQGATIELSTPDELAKALETDMARWAEIVKDSGARIE